MLLTTSIKASTYATAGVLAMRYGYSKRYMQQILKRNNITFINGRSKKIYKQDIFHRNPIKEYNVQEVIRILGTTTTEEKSKFHSKVIKALKDKEFRAMVKAYIEELDSK
jgi:hypothetical protein